MKNEKQEEKKLENVECKKTRSFHYSNKENEVGFEFEIDVSNPEIALAEISDFMDLMAQSFQDLKELQNEFAVKIEKKEEPKKEQKKETNSGIQTAS